jgi:hypothetical protein
MKEINQAIEEMKLGIDKRSQESIKIYSLGIIKVFFNNIKSFLALSRYLFNNLISFLRHFHICMLLFPIILFFSRS